MDRIEIDVEVSAKDLFAFSMRHAYVSFSGVMGLLISFSSLGLLLVRFSSMTVGLRIVCAILATLFTVVQPCMLYSKAKLQAKQNENINGVLHYVFSEEGVTISQGEQQVQVAWGDIRKKVRTKKVIYIYMSAIRAFIIPKNQCEDSFEQLGSMIDERMKLVK